MKKVIFIMAIVVVIATFAGCAKEETTYRSHCSVNLADICEVTLTENIETENILVEKTIDNEYERESSYNSQENSWN